MKINHRTGRQGIGAAILPQADKTDEEDDPDNPAGGGFPNHGGIYNWCH